MLKTLSLGLMTMLLALIFSGCSTDPVKTTPEVVKEVPGPTRVVDNSCVYFKPITPTDDDVRLMSRTLIDQISNHDKIGMQHCGWKFGSTK